MKHTFFKALFSKKKSLVKTIYNSYQETAFKIIDPYATKDMKQAKKEEILKSIDFYAYLIPTF
jgi:hypothetical protein